MLDIGSGWGGLGLFLADYSGVNVTGVTLSEEQHRVSNERARDAGTGAARARFELQDYRALDTAVRPHRLGRHVRACRRGALPRVLPRGRDLLKPDGVMLLHSIGRFGPPGTTNPWIAKYIFPGGYIPALSEVMKAVERLGLFVTDIEILRLHYAETLKAWRERFRAQLGRGGAHLRRAVLPHVGFLPRRLGGGLPRRRHDGLPDPAHQEPERAAHHARLHRAPPRHAFNAAASSGPNRCASPANRIG